MKTMTIDEARAMADAYHLPFPVLNADGKKRASKLLKEFYGRLPYDEKAMLPMFEAGAVALLFRNEHYIKLSRPNRHGGYDDAYVAMKPEVYDWIYTGEA
jgi:hypothetical protein